MPKIQAMYISKSDVQHNLCMAVGETTLIEEAASEICRSSDFTFNMTVTTYVHCGHLPVKISKFHKNFQG